MTAGKGFYLGEVLDAGSGERTGERVHYDPSDLNTHGVIVGMTGSGKTGLGVIFLEESLRAGIPALILDPKGDMTNLLLTFPGLTPAEFRPWVDETAARREERTPDEAAVAAAAAWSKGLEASGLGPEDIRALRDAADFHLYTPGSLAGVPLDVLGSLAVPEGTDVEARRDLIEAFVTGLLHLAGITADPLASREHILLANLVETAWEQGTDLTLEELIARVHRPPLRKLGVFELDTFFPEKDRLALALRLNNLVASPSFAAWRSGPPLDIPSLLWNPEGKPRAAILYLAHLGDDERQFAVSLALSALITWMRSQPGSSSLRVLVYMDEVFGFVPPTASPPAKKPLLTLFKQARAYGVGMLLATQNPMDLDYKAMSNAGTWCIGLLQTERDKARILEALRTAEGGADVARFDRMISGLGKRHFLLHRTRVKEPTRFTTRWAMSYLRGPLTLPEIAELTADDPRRREAAAPSDAPPSPAPADDETTAAPRVAAGVPVYHLDPGAPWAEQAGARRGSTRLAAALAARAHLTYRDAAAGVHHVEEWEAVFYPIARVFDPTTGVAVDYDARDFLAEAPAGVTYLLPEADLAAKAYFTGATRALKEHLARAQTVEVQRNRAVKLYSRVGESSEEFAARCDAAAQAAADAEAAKIRDRFKGRLDTLRRQIDGERFRVDQAALDEETRRQEELASGVGTLLGVFLGGRRSTRSLSTAASKRSMTRKAEQRRVGAEARLSGKVEDLQALEDDLAAELADLDASWSARAAEVETVPLAPLKSSVAVSEMAVVWLPVD
ncbi:MAG: ATP-binding protein [Actinobacteria bacterium]|nr:ATP-binding protein [Actinomycetota bacterium]